MNRRTIDLLIAAAPLAVGGVAAGAGAYLARKDDEREYANLRANQESIVTPDNIPEGYLGEAAQAYADLARVAPKTMARQSLALPLVQKAIQPGVDKLDVLERAVNIEGNLATARMYPKKKNLFQSAFSATQNLSKALVPFAQQAASDGPSRIPPEMEQLAQASEGSGYSNANSVANALERANFLAGVMRLSENPDIPPLIFTTPEGMEKAIEVGKGMSEEERQSLVGQAVMTLPNFLEMIKKSSAIPSDEDLGKGLGTYVALCKHAVDDVAERYGLNKLATSKLPLWRRFGTEILTPKLMKTEIDEVAQNAAETALRNRRNTFQEALLPALIFSGISGLSSMIPMGVAALKAGRESTRRTELLEKTFQEALKRVEKDSSDENLRAREFLRTDPVTARNAAREAFGVLAVAAPTLATNPAVATEFVRNSFWNRGEIPQDALQAYSRIQDTVNRGRKSVFEPLPIEISKAILKGTGKSLEELGSTAARMG